MALEVPVVYVPFLEGAFGTTAQIATDGLFCTGVAKLCVVGERHHNVRCST